MDKFENAIVRLSKIPVQERMDAVGKAKSMCICPGCPTYTDCARKAQERLFCIIGGSFICISQEKDCLCPSCPVAADMGLTRKFFCTRGSERSQRWGEELMTRK